VISVIHSKKSRAPSFQKITKIITKYNVKNKKYKKITNKIEKIKKSRAQFSSTLPLRCVYLPRINHTIASFVESWNNHPHAP